MINHITIQYCLWRTTMKKLYLIVLVFQLLFPSYDVKMTEVHHIHKLDAPSGTAITLAEGILENIDRKDRWTLENAESATDLPIHAIREGEVPGIHEITYESDVDTISIKHDAKSRAGFALGAVVAAEFTAGKKGFLGMNDLFKF